MTAYVDDFADRFRLRVEITCDPRLPSLTARTQAEVVRIVQEAMNNVRRHADATLVHVRLGAGLVLGAPGAGVAASFTDGAHADMAITVGTFDITLSSSHGQVSADGDTVTYHAPTIDSSDPASAPFSFTIHNNGTMAAAIHLSATAVPAPFHDYLVAHPVADFTLAAGDSQEITAGLTWTELGMSDLGDTYSITYTVTASA